MPNVYKKATLLSIIVILFLLLAFFVGYGMATWKWNCCGWGEGCERNIDSARCDRNLGFD